MEGKYRERGVLVGGCRTYLTFSLIFSHEEIKDSSLNYEELKGVRSRIIL